VKANVDRQGVGLEVRMTALECALWITGAGAFGGVVNTVLAREGFRLPQYEAGVLCPGFVGNVLVGAFAAVISWALYGSGAGLELAREGADPRQALSLTAGALAGAAMVGVAGARWLTSEVDKNLLRESVSRTAEKVMTAEQVRVIARAPAREVLRTIQEASSAS
jgi:hypothetical protein